MKRLGTFVHISILVTILLFNFSIFEKAFAQETGTPLTLAQYQAKGEGFFATQLSLLQAKKTETSAAGTVPVQPAVIDALIKAVTEAKTVFSSTLNGNSPAPASYKKALLDASTYISTEQQKNGQILRQPYANNVIGAFTRQLNDEAIAAEKAAALQQGGYTADDVKILGDDLTNARATAVGATTQAKKAPIGKCSLFMPSNIAACIDEGLAWLIKHTLLRLAGFLLFLTGSMLNYAVQLSILDFSRWAPEALYPIWTVIRQIVSLAVVFAGLFLGFMYIIGREDTFGRYIGWLCVFALFVNFSYPFSRALVDVSNIVSLNIYSAALGPEALTGSKGAGDIIKDELNIPSLIGQVGKDEGGEADEQKINNVPGSLLAVAFVLYAAYIFFMATVIIAVRTGVLVFLIIASPLLLVDSVVPKLGDVAVKLRKAFFSQLIVAPVFMIMLALTLKFLDVFHSAAGVKTDSVTVFFNLLMMLIMLHIMLTVTREVAGGVGDFATKWAGKVGGFGLGAASMGTGMLARGTLGAAAARVRDSGWMDKLQGSRTGRGLYGLTNSLAQSTFDSRNIGMVNRGMASAGMSMGKGSTQTYDKRFAEKEKTFNKKLRTIKDGNARQGYIDQTKESIASKTGRLILGKSDGDLITKRALDSRAKVAEMYKLITDPARKQAYYQEHKTEIDFYNQETKAKEEQVIFSSRLPDDVVPAPDTIVEEKITTAEDTKWKDRDIPAYQRKTQAEQAAKEQEAAEKKKEENEELDTSYVDMAEGRSPKQSAPVAAQATTEPSALQGQEGGHVMTASEMANMQKRFSLASSTTLGEAMRQRRPSDTTAPASSSTATPPKAPSQAREVREALPA